MTQPLKQERQKATLLRLPVLIELFYGLAIANGLADAIKSTLEKGSLFQWLFLTVAFLLGLGDWLGYHMHVSQVPYRNLWRLLMDLMFPVLVYCLLLAPSLTPAAGGLNFVAWVVFAYFVLAVPYSILLRRDDPQCDPSLTRIVVTSFAISLAAVVSSYLLPAVSLRIVLVDALAMAAVALWAAYNLRLLHRTLQQDSPRPFN